jgi:hypothetical protein
MRHIELRQMLEALPQMQEEERKRLRENHHKALEKQAAEHEAEGKIMAAQYQQAVEYAVSTYNTRLAIAMGKLQAWPKMSVQQKLTAYAQVKNEATKGLPLIYDSLTQEERDKHGVSDGHSALLSQEFLAEGEKVIEACRA